jgi:peptidoglycan hydrolase FlgJ
MDYDIKSLSSLSNLPDGQVVLSQVLQAQRSSRLTEAADLRGAAHEFEAYFISNLLKVMRETVPKGALENKGGAYFYSFYDQEIGRLASDAGGIGIAKMIHEYTEKTLLPSLKFSEPTTDTVVEKNRYPTGKGLPE